MTSRTISVAGPCVHCGSTRSDRLRNINGDVTCVWSAECHRRVLRAARPTPELLGVPVS